MNPNPEAHHENVDNLASQAEQSLERRISELEKTDNDKSAALVRMKADIMNKIKTGGDDPNTEKKESYLSDLRLDTKELTEVYTNLESGSKTLLHANGIQNVEDFFKLIGFRQMELNLDSGSNIIAKGYKRAMPLWETDKVLKIEPSKVKKIDGREYVYAEVQHDRGKFRPDLRRANRYRVYKGYVLKNKLIKVKGEVAKPRAVAKVDAKPARKVEAKPRVAVKAAPKVEAKPVVKARPKAKVELKRKPLEKPKGLDLNKIELTETLPDGTKYKTFARDPRGNKDQPYGTGFTVVEGLDGKRFVFAHTGVPGSVGREFSRRPESRRKQEKLAMRQLYGMVTQKNIEIFITFVEDGLMKRRIARLNKRLAKEKPPRKPVELETYNVSHSKIGGKDNNAIVARIAQLFKEGKNVSVNCRAGKHRAQAMFAMGLIQSGKFQSLKQVKDFMGFEIKWYTGSKGNKMMGMQIIQFAARKGMPIDAESLVYWKKHDGLAKKKWGAAWPAINRAVLSLAGGQKLRSRAARVIKRVLEKGPDPKTMGKVKAGPGGPKAPPPPGAVDDLFDDKPKTKPAPKRKAEEKKPEAKEPKLDAKNLALRKHFAKERKAWLSAKGGLTPDGQFALKMINQANYSSDMEAQMAEKMRKAFKLPRDKFPQVTEAQLIDALGGPLDAKTRVKERPATEEQRIGNEELPLPDKVHKVERSNFNETLRRGNTLLVISAPGCKNCDKLARMLAQISTLFPGKFKVAIIKRQDEDLNNNPLMKRSPIPKEASHVNNAVPLLYVLKNGKRRHSAGSGIPELSELLPSLEKEYGIQANPKEFEKIALVLLNTSPRSLLRSISSIPKKDRKRFIDLALNAAGTARLFDCYGSSLSGRTKKAISFDDPRAALLREPFSKELFVKAATEDPGEALDDMWGGPKLYANAPFAADILKAAILNYKAPNSNPLYKLENILNGIKVHFPAHVQAQIPEFLKLRNN